MHHLSTDDDADKDREHVSDWSTFWGEPDPSESNGIRSNWKKNLYQLLQEPTSSQGAFTIHICVTLLIVIAALLTILETIPSFRAIDSRIWFGFETAIVVIFTIEYFARIAAHSDSWSMLWRWSKSFFALIDLASILPYYIEVAIQTDASNFFHFSILRTFRLLRVFRAFRYSSKLLLTIEVMVLSFKRSADALIALSFLVCTLVALFATFLYFIERGSWDANLEQFMNSDGQPSSFESIPAAAWFVLVTISTVGYGEVTPTTTIGRLITLPLLVFGLLLIALPSFVLGRNFSIVWDTVTSHHNTETIPKKRNYTAVPTAAGFDIPSEPEPIFDSRQPYGSSDNTALRPNMDNRHNTQTEENYLASTSTMSNESNVVDEVKSLRLAINQQSRDIRILMDALSQRQI
ncbi:Potassium voltage-gated channel protein Shal [Wallemia ichthyophaga EXF-994]|uniref:Potassium voltage-gated channel protein Shal n=1 Tax=Wallemia ichthyophaga (strain EXF-994 / CBS 113033) TaxID=1299270 RepID=R9AFH5_WALI9|nr:Potassium voltage-gated channel protein Shal [Wallemia ichthyophaga EXF-994]EOR00870.1 Potassium voltage-gated channel protein Shal [Wallemia ichthyophaga EXF-994]